MRPLSADSARESLLRFDLNVQRRHLYVYAAALITSGIGSVIGVFPLNFPLAATLCAGAAIGSGVFYWLFWRGVDRRILNPLWMAVDVFVVTLGVYVTGGLGSPWFIWYVTTTAAAAFVGGAWTILAVGVANTVAYIGVLLLMGQIRLFDAAFTLAFSRMLFLFGASYFFLLGVSRLQEKRLRIRQLEAEENRQVNELTRLTGELQQRSRELAEANRHIQEANRLKSQFLANMSHELRTPMNSIIGFSEILVDRLDGRIDVKHASFLRHILTSGQHLLSIINDILDLSKIEAGKMEIYPERFAVRAVAESVCTVMRGMTRDHVPTFVIDVPDDLPPLEADLAKFKQVLFNLLSNAIKFSPPQAPITISARHIGPTPGDGTITVSVRDEGIGIDPKHHEVIFEEFRQVDGTARREFGGTGLGLALVKKFIELQGGYVSVQSAPGRGSIFSFTLPVHSRAAVVSRAPEDNVAPPPITERVLVVEDDAHSYELISSALGSAGYLAVRARHGDEALKIARESRPVAVTLDLVLPGVDGWDVLKRLKSDPSTRDIPVVIISMIENRELGVALGADDYFVKPVDRERLLNRIHQLTRNSRPRLLLIDDDATLHKLLDEQLARLGYTIESAFTGESGVKAAKQSAPDVIILDLMMPGMSGFEVAGALKESPETANIPIVVLTSKEISADDRRELQSKVTSFVQKGKSAREQLVTEIRRLRRAIA
ncbi:MAG TPA: response regulator [Thermoanaerobaculia bacterium]|nr:response regulator [Thermoanaerobaculia bacterium]